MYISFGNLATVEGDSIEKPYVFIRPSESLQSEKFKEGFSIVFRWFANSCLGNYKFELFHQWLNRTLSIFRSHRLWLRSHWFWCLHDNPDSPTIATSAFNFRSSQNSNLYFSVTTGSTSPINVWIQNLQNVDEYSIQNLCFTSLRPIPESPSFPKNT